MIRCFLLFLFFALGAGAEDIERPPGQLLYQPMFIWMDSDVTQQGTGYLVENAAGKVFGVTSIHFMYFEYGLFEAIWLDIPSSVPACGFRTSYGRPLTKEIAEFTDVKRDFILLPAAEGCFDENTRLELDDRKRIESGEKLWFPNKDFESPEGHTWIEAEVSEDLGYLIEIKLDGMVVLESQSGSPFISQETGKVVGMLTSAWEEDGRIWVNACPGRNVLRFLEKPREPVPLSISVQ